MTGFHIVCHVLYNLKKSYLRFQNAKRPMDVLVLSQQKAVEVDPLQVADVSNPSSKDAV